MDTTDTNQATDVPVTLKFMSDMDEHLSGKAANVMENIFTVLQKIPRENKIQNIEELISKKIEDFPIKVLMAPDLLTFFNKYDIPYCNEFVSFRLLIIS